MAKKLGERLVEAGLVTREAVEQALQHQKITGHKLGECLVDLGLIQETALLRFLASDMNTRFVSAEKLAKVKVPPEVLDKVPVRMAEAQHFLPIAIDPERKILSIVAAEPQNQALMQEIALVTGMEEVYAFIGLRSAILAAIKKHYYGDPTAFSAMGTGNMRSDVKAVMSAIESTAMQHRGGTPVLALRFETDPRARLARNTSIGGQPTGVRDVLGIVRSTVGDNDFAETLNILVGLLEAPKKGLRGHSSQLARQGTLVARRLGLAPKDITHIAVAAYLHDLGKPQDKHLTLAGIASDAQHRADAKRYVRAPIKLFETVHLAPQVNNILAQVFEAFDGSGVPGSAKGDEIAIGARILAALDSYLELMKNASNSRGRKLSRDEALAHLSENSGKLYDPVVVDIVGRIHSGELLRQRIETDGRQILIADPDEAVRTDLLDALTKEGIVTQALTTLDGAVDATLAGEVDVLVLALRFGVAEVAGLVDLLRGQPATAALPVVVLGEPPDAMGKQQLAQVGVTSVLPMPFDPAEAAKVIAAAYRLRIDEGAPAQQVRGSFDEMPQAELLKVLAGGHKSGRLSLRSDGHEGYLQLEKGRVVFAQVNGQSGAGAMAALLGLQHAEFVYDPDSLLLEMPDIDQDLDVVLKRAEAGAA